MVDVTPGARKAIREVAGLHDEPEVYANPLSLVPNPLERRLARGCIDLAERIAELEAERDSLAEFGNSLRAEVVSVTKEANTLAIQVSKMRAERDALQSEVEQRRLGADMLASLRQRERVGDFVNGAVWGAVIHAFAGETMTSGEVAQSAREKALARIEALGGDDAETPD